MKRLHHPDLLSWSRYQETLHADFNGFLWSTPSRHRSRRSPFPGLRVRELDGSKTPVELALVLEDERVAAKGFELIRRVFANLAKAFHFLQIRSLAQSL